MNGLPSASYWNLLSICQLPAALPWTERVGDDDTERGNDRHRFLQRVGSGMPREQALAMVPAATRAQCEAMDLPRMDVEPGAYRCESAFALNPASFEGAWLGDGLTRAERHDKAPRMGCAGWIEGTVDRWGAVGNIVVIRDFKGPHQHLPALREDWQLRNYRLAVASYQGADEVIVAVDRIREDGSHHIIGPETFTYADLIDDAAKLQSLVAKVRAAQADPASATPVEGPHCTTCPARLACPAKVARMGALVRERPDPKTLTRDELTRVALALPAAEAWLEEVKKEIKAEATRQPFVAPDGRVFGPKAEDDLEHAETTAILDELHAMFPDVDGAHAYEERRVVTAASLDAFTRLVASSRGLTRKRKEIRERLRQAGALPQRDVYRWRKPETSAPATTPAADSAPRPALEPPQGGAASLSEVE